MTISQAPQGVMSNITSIFFEKFKKKLCDLAQFYLFDLK